MLARLSIAVLALFACEALAFEPGYRPLPSSITGLAVSDSVPDATTPNDLSIDDFQIDWLGGEIPGVRARFVPGSLDWVRVADLVVPRGRALIEVDSALAGTVSHAGFTQTFRVDQGHAKAEFPVALLSGEHNPISIKLDSGRTGTLVISFAPKPDRPRWGVSYDTSCSPYQVETREITGTRKNQWAFVGCRLIRLKGEPNATSSLEMFLLWDNVGQTIRVNGMELASTVPFVWAIRLSPDQDSVTIETTEKDPEKRERVKIGYRIPKKLHNAFLGLGLGPYAHTFEGTDKNTHTYTALATVYGSLFLDETAQLIFFNATPLHPEYYSDFGFYVRILNTIALDRRFSFNLMFGGHAIAFDNLEQTYIRITAPQGLEFVIKDFLKAGHNLTLGAFIYPRINNQFYNNLWLRWGTGRFFGELNYISWQETLDRENLNTVYARSVGISIGMPLFFFF